MTETFHAGPNLGRLSDVTIIHGDCIEAMRELADNSIDAIVTDPPYGLGFMGKEWDALPPGLPWAQECLRVLKPGGHLLAFGGTRTWHRLAVAVEDAGFEIRDSIAWLYGSGFPKSLDVGKAIDKTDAAAVRLTRAREFQGWLRQHLTPKQVDEATSTNMGYHYTTHPTQPSIATVAHLDLLRPLLPDVPQWVEEMAQQRTVESENYNRRPMANHESRPGMAQSWTDGSGWTGSTARGGSAITPEAEQWQGWGTALKPAHEPVVHGIKPYPDKAILDFIGSHLTAMEKSCRPDVRLAGLSSAPTPADSLGARTASAPASAATQHADGSENLTRTGAVDDSSGLTDTSVSESMESTCWSIVTSWLSSWDEICEATSTSTTSTTTSQTTDLKTLWSYLSRITLDDMARNIQSQDSSPSLVDLVDSLFSAGALNSRSILLRTAIENATSEGRDPSPAFEPVVVGRKPFRGNVAANVLAHGTGALNIDACRITHGNDVDLSKQQRQTADTAGMNGLGQSGFKADHVQPLYAEGGRWPANVVLDESQAAALDEQSGTLSYNPPATYRRDKADAVQDRSSFVIDREGGDVRPGYGDKGGASRFFLNVAPDPDELEDLDVEARFKYCAKAPKKERPVTDDGTSHATVKPLTLMRWLVRLVTPPGGVVLDPFAGSGTTVEAALLEGFQVISIERETDYLPLIQQRIARCLNS